MWQQYHRRTSITAENMVSAVRPAFVLVFLLFALLAVEIPARVLEQGEEFVLDPAQVAAIVEPMVRQARQQSTATLTVLKTVCIHTILTVPS